MLVSPHAIHTPGLILQVITPLGQKSVSSILLWSLASHSIWYCKCTSADLWSELQLILQRYGDETSWRIRLQHNSPVCACIEAWSRAESSSPSWRLRPLTPPPHVCLGPWGSAGSDSKHWSPRWKSDRPYRHWQSELGLVHSPLFLMFWSLCEITNKEKPKQNQH